MISDLLIAVLGVILGAMAGLLPAIPAWLVPFFLLPTLTDFSAYQIAIFWLSTMIASQFFSSISSISFGIPGENSSLVYINDTNQLCPADRIRLLQQTADASAIATFVALIFATAVLPSLITNIYFFSTTVFTAMVVYWAAIMIIFVNHGNPWANLLLFSIGVGIASHDNIALPGWLLAINSVTYDVTVINLLVGLILIPRILERCLDNDRGGGHSAGQNNSRLIKNTMIGTAVGMLSGFLPGPTATIASSLAYKSGGVNLYDRVIRAESANNSVIIVGAVVFMILNIPLALDTITINELLTRTGFNQGLHTIIDAAFVLIITGSTVLAWLLSRNSLKLYAAISMMINSRILAALLTVCLIMLDLSSSMGSHDLGSYFTWLLIFSLMGVMTVRNDTSAIPAILGFILGPTMIWTTFQLST